MSKHIIKEKNLVVRHSFVELIEHWAIAVSGLVLFLSGLFQMPLSKRYGISKLPGMEWSADFMFTLKLHYIASVVFVGAAIFHVIYHGMLKETGMLPKRGDLKQSVEVIKSFLGKGAEPPFHKYLPEQRLAYVGMAAVILGLIVTGMIKVVKNVYMPDMPLEIVWWATTMHNVFFVLFFLAFLAHMAAIIIKPNRPMVRGIFTGNIRLDYALHRHPLWIDEIRGNEVEIEHPEALPADLSPQALPEKAQEFSEEVHSESEVDASQEICILHDKDSGKFHCEINGFTCSIEYELTSDNSMDVYRTFVDSSLRGRGIAELLIKSLIAYAEQNSLKIKPSCSYAVGFFRKNPEHSQMLSADSNLDNEGSCRLT